MPAVAATGSWRVAWLAVPLLSSLVSLAAVALLRPTARPVDEPHDAAARAGERGIAAWAIGETLLFAAWGGTLVYAGALLRDSYACPARRRLSRGPVEERRKARLLMRRQRPRFVAADAGEPMPAAIDGPDIRSCYEVPTVLETSIGQRP